MLCTLFQLMDRSVLLWAENFKIRRDTLKDEEKQNVWIQILQDCPSHPKEIISRRKNLILCHFLATEIIKSSMEGLNLKTEQEKKQGGTG